MTIQSTIHSLYAIMCAAEEVCKDPKKDTSTLLHCLKMVSDKDVDQAVNDVQYLLTEMASINSNLRGMYILHYTTGTDKENKSVLLQTECVWGTQTMKFTTQFDIKAAQSLVDALNMSIAMVKAGNRLSEEGRA